MKDKIRENAKKYFEEELSGEPLYQDLVIDWLTEFAEQQVKLFTILSSAEQSELSVCKCGGAEINTSDEDLAFVSMRDVYGELREIGLNSELADKIAEWSKSL